MGSPTVTPLTERRHDGGYIVWEPQNGMVTRKEILLASGAGICEPGLVLGQIGHALVAIAAALGTNTGNGTFGVITVGAPAIAGLYKLQMVAATRFILEDPLGVEIGQGATGGAFAAGGIGFTLTAGGTPHVAGDSFTLTVAVGSLKYVAYDPTANNGAERAAAILYGLRDASSADKKAVANASGPMRINAAELVWGANVTTNQHKIDALAALAALPGGGIQAS